MSSPGIFKDRYGFWFWLRWILWFAGSFVASAVFWTFFLIKIFGKITGPELEITWSSAVFGSWFLLVIPFMRKKEQIWKRLNDDQEKAVDAWFQGMSILIAALVLDTLFWSLRMREAINAPGLDRAWIKNTGGTWLLALVPLAAFMYRRADVIFRRADQKQSYSPNYQRTVVPLEERTLSNEISQKLRSFPETLPHGHMVSVLLNDGRKISHVFIKYRREIAGVYDRSELGFRSSDIKDVDPTNAENWPVVEESKWLRID